MTSPRVPTDSLMLTIGGEIAFDSVLASVRAAFKEEGFGVLTEIDVQKTLSEKIDFKLEPYTILGVCNPVLASRAITVDPKIGLFLPCNVLVARVNGLTEVTAQDPMLMVQMTNNEALQSIAEEANARIVRALARLK